MVLYVGNIISAGGALDSDYYVITYQWTDGEDLDTRTRITHPVVSEYLGYNWDSAYPYSGPSIIEWGDDEVGVGYESILFDKDVFLNTFPNETYVDFELRAHWYGEQGFNPVVVDVTGYRGGEMIYLPDDYTWTNTTYTEIFDSFTSYSKVITLLEVDDDDDTGEFIINMRLDFENYVVTYFT